MLRITVLNDDRGATFKMEGKLAHEWVTEAEKVWAAFSKSPQQGCVVVDLCGVSFVDDTGRELLARMHASGAKLIGTGPMTSALIREICGEDRPPDRRWIRSLMSLFFMLLVAGTAPTTNNLFISPPILLSGVVAAAISEPMTLVRLPVHISVPGDKRRASAFRKGLCR
jgi:hypothetical protein